MAKKISTTTIEKIIKANTPENITGEFTITDGKTVEIVIKPYISFEEYCQAANDIANSCYDAEGNYHPEFFNLSYNVALIEYFTNIDMGALSEDNDDENAEDKAKEKLHQIHSLCGFTTLIDKIESTVKQALDIKKDAKAIIEHRNSRKTSPWDSVAEGISSLLDTIIEQADKFGDIDKKDIQNMFKLGSSLSNFNEGEVVNKILEFRDKESRDK